jgi:hypothetical protein
MMRSSEATKFITHFTAGNYPERLAQYTLRQEQRVLQWEAEQAARKEEQALIKAEAAALKRRKDTWRRRTAPIIENYNQRVLETIGRPSREWEKFAEEWHDLFRISLPPSSYEGSFGQPLRDRFVEKLQKHKDTVFPVVAEGLVLMGDYRKGLMSRKQLREALQKVVEDNQDWMNPAVKHPMPKRISQLYPWLNKAIPVPAKYKREMAA